jgi:hypothetical protein
MDGLMKTAFALKMHNQDFKENWIIASEPFVL